MTDCKCLKEDRKKLPDLVQEQFIRGNLETVRIRVTQCKACGQKWNNGIDMDAVRSGKSNGIYGVTHAE